MVAPASNKKFKIIALVLLFALPAIMATGLYMGRDYFEFTPKSFGTLLTPPLALEKLNIKTVDGNTVSQGDFASSWWLIYVAPPECTDECAIQAAKLRSVHMALNKNVPRVKRLLLLQAHSLSNDQLKQAQQDKQLTVDRIQNPDYLLNNCPVATQEVIFIMDPLGNIMLCYAPTQEAHLILQDVEKLLKASRIG